MSGLTCISSLPPELLYTILSHALADILFDYLFVGALLLDDNNNDHPAMAKPNPGCGPGMEEISSLGRVSVAWRATLHRILAALLHVQSQSLLLPTKHHQHQVHRAHHHQLTTRTTTARAHPSSNLINSPISISISPASASTINATHATIIGYTHATNANTTIIPSLHPYQRTLHTMQIALRDLVQHSIDTYRNEQDQDATMGGQANQTGVTTPTLLPPPPVPVPVTTPVQVIPPPPVQHPGTGAGNGVGTPPLVPHSQIPPHSIPPTHPPATASMSNPNPSASAPPQPNFSPPAHNHLLGALLLIAAPTLKGYATTPLFQAALCYSQAAVFTCQSSSSNSFSSSTKRPQPTGRWNLYEGVTHHAITGSASGGGSSTTARAGASRAIGIGVVRRPDLSTLVLTTPRLVAALEWMGGHNRISPRDARICPREVCEVVECGMGEVKERIEDAIQVCRWNDLLHAVFLRGERSEEMLEALDGCFDDLEANAGSIQMHHLLRSTLFKTVQTIARLGPISLGPTSQGNPNLHTPPQARAGSNTPPPHGNGNGEVWRSRAGALAFRWMGRVVEWTGF